MIYHKISEDCEPKVVGVTHGLGQAHFDASFLQRHPWFRSIFYETELLGSDSWKVWANITQYAQPLEEILMEKKAKHTDFIGLVNLMRGFIVNDKLRVILESFHLPKHKFLEVTFKQKGNLIGGYWWFVYDLDTGEETVDFARSEYNLRYHRQKFGDDFQVKVSNYAEYLNVFTETGSGLRASKLVLTEKFDQELDLLGFQFLNPDIYISDRLLDRLNQAQITGFEVYSVERLRRRAQITGNPYFEFEFPK